MSETQIETDSRKSQQTENIDTESVSVNVIDSDTIKKQLQNIFKYILKLKQLKVIEKLAFRKKNVIFIAKTDFRKSMIF